MSKAKLKKENQELRAALDAIGKAKYTQGFRWEDYGRECCSIIGISEDPRELQMWVSRKANFKNSWHDNALSEPAVYQAIDTFTSSSRNSQSRSDAAIEYSGIQYIDAPNAPLAFQAAAGAIRY